MTPLPLALVVLGGLAQGAAPASEPLATALAELRAETSRLGDDRALRAPDRRRLLDRLAELRFAALEGERRVVALQDEMARLRAEAVEAEEGRAAAASRLTEARVTAAALSAAFGVPCGADAPDAAVRKALEVFETRRSPGDAPTVTEAEIAAPDGSPRLADELRLGTVVLRVARDGSVMAVAVAGPDGTVRWEPRTDWSSLRAARLAVATARRQHLAEVMLLPAGLP